MEYFEAMMHDDIKKRFAEAYAKDMACQKIVEDLKGNKDVTNPFLLGAAFKLISI